MIKKENALFINDDIGTVKITNPHTEKKCWVVFGRYNDSGFDDEFQIIGVGDTQDIAIKDALIRCFDFRKNSAHKDNIAKYLSEMFSLDHQEPIFHGDYPEYSDKYHVLPLFKKVGDEYDLCLSIGKTDFEGTKEMQYCLFFN